MIQICIGKKVIFAFYQLQWSAAKGPVRSCGNRSVHNEAPHRHQKSMNLTRQAMAILPDYLCEDRDPRKKGALAAEIHNQNLADVQKLYYLIPFSTFNVVQS